MSLSNTTKSSWCCLLLLHVMGFLDLVQTIAVTISPQPQKPKTVEAQAKFFQDFFSVQLSPHMLEFGHVCEDPNNWEQRYEHKDYKNHRDMGKVRWGDKQGGYGEHYWDLNHAGAKSNDNDDGSYDPRTEDENYDQKKNKDLFEEPSEPKPNYESDGVYNIDRSDSQYDELGRRKRANPKIKPRRQTQNEEGNYPEQNTRKSKPKQYSDEILQADNTQTVEVADDDEDDEQYDDEIEEEEEEPVTKKPVRKTKKFRKKQKIEEPEIPETEKSLPESELPNPETQQLPVPYTTTQQYVTRTLPEVNHNKQYVPYESGAGVRQHFQAENLTPAVPRLFLEPSTGHVVDRATGQAYVLQPILTGPY